MVEEVRGESEAKMYNLEQCRNKRVQATDEKHPTENNKLQIWGVDVSGYKKVRGPNVQNACVRVP